MRPTIPELLERLEETFNQVIVPEVASEYARTRALVVSGMINHLRTRVALEDTILREHVDDLTTTFQSIGPRLKERTAPELRALGGALETETGRSEDGVAQDQGGLRARYVTLAALAEQLVDALERTEGSEGDASIAPIRAELRGVLRRMIDRDLRLVAPPQHGARGSEPGPEETTRAANA